MFGVAALAVGGQQGLRLDRVAQRGAGAVALDEVHLGRRQPSTGQRVLDHPLLGGAVGRGLAVARAVLVDRRTAHHRQHPVPQPLGVGEALQHQHADALAPAGAVRGRRVGLAAAVGGEPALTGELDEDAGGRQHRHPARQRQRALALAQRLHRLVQGDQRGGARRVHRDGRTLEPQVVGDPPGHQAADAAAAGVVVVVERPGEDTGPGALQGLRVDPGALQRLPGRLQHQPLLRIDAVRLARGDSEERRVEVGGVVQESTGAGVGPPALPRLRVVQGVDVPAAVGRELADHVLALDHDVPEVVGGGHAAGQPAAHADDRHRLVPPALGRLQPAPSGVQLLGDRLEVLQQFFFGGHGLTLRSGRWGLRRRTRRCRGCWSRSRGLRRRWPRRGRPDPRPRSRTGRRSTAPTGRAGSRSGWCAGRR